MAGRLLSRRLTLVVALTASIGVPSGAADGWYAVAHAADPLPARGLVEVLPVGPITADGRSETVIHALVMAPDGAPVVGAKLRASMDGAETGDVQDLGNGLYRVVVTPNASDTASTGVLSLKGRADTLGLVDTTHELTLRPGAPGRVQVTTNMPSLTLGQDGYATISFTLPTDAGPAPTADDILVRASSGEVRAITQMGSGRFTARYEPPDVNYPHLAILTLADRRAPADVYGTTAVRLMGKVDYPVTAPSGANIVLRVGGREFGPVTVDGTGRALVPIVVPPGISAATQITAAGGDVREEMIDLRVPPTRRMALFPAPTSLPSDSRVQVPLRMVVLRPDGAPDPSATPTLTATAGRVSRPTHVGDGVYEATFTPPDGRVEVAATVQAQVGEGGEGDALELRMTPPMPASLALSTEPTTLSVAGTALDVFASLRAADGSGLPGRDVSLTVLGASPKGPLVDLSGGDYRRSFSADEGTDVRVQAIARAPLSDNAASRVVLVPASSQVEPGGELQVLVVSADRFGYPVAGRTVNLSTGAADARVPASVTTDEHGLATVTVTAGRDPGLLTLRGDLAGVVDVVGVLQADVKGVPAFPASGDGPTRAVRNAWQAAQGTLFVDREGVDALPGAVSPPASAAGPVSALAVTATPEGVIAGQDTVLVIEARDAEGVAVDGVPLELFATAGAIPGEVEALGGGRYRANVTAPASLQGPVKVNVVADGGKAVSVVQLEPVEADSDDPWGTGSSGTVVTAAPAEESASDDEALPEMDRPWLRARVSFLLSGYSYDQTPGDDPGPLYPSALGWGFERGGSALPLGLDTSLRFVHEDLPYVGVQGGFRWSRYAVESSVFDNPAVDNLFFARVALVGRYPIELGRDEIGIGARIGFRWDDFVTFRGSGDPGTAITYEPLGLPGLDVGLEVSAEFWKMYLLASGTAGFAYGSVPYAATVDLNLGYQVTRYFAVDLGFGFSNRSATLEGNDSGVVRGTVRDQQILGTLGVAVGW